MLINKFDLQLFADEESAEAVEVEESTEEMPSEGEEPTETETPDYSEADQAFLDRFEITFDKNPKKFDTIDSLREAAEMGSALPRYKENVAKLEQKLSSPQYKWMDEYMKSCGYEDGSEFVKAIKVNEKTTEYINNGMSEEAAKQAAEDYVSKAMNQKQPDKSTVEIDEFLKWHDSKVEAGKFKESLDVNSIPQEVLEAYKNGVSLKEAFMDHMLDNIKTNTEQETLRKLNKNKETSTGELKPSPSNDGDMSKEQIKKILSEMSSSERTKWINKNYDKIEKSGIYN